jgi:hypothetical protein
MVWEDVDLNEFSNNVEGLTTCTSSDKKVDTIIEVVDLLVDLSLDLLAFVDVLLLLGDLSVDCVWKSGIGVWVVIGIRIIVNLELNI